MGTESAGSAFHVEDLGSYSAVGDQLVASIRNIAGECVDPCACPGDIDGDGDVGIVDFLALLGMWGPCSDCAGCAADLDTEPDGDVGITDFLILLGEWGQCPCPGFAGGESGSDLDAALDALGFSSLPHYHTWLVSVTEIEGFLSALTLVTELIGQGGQGQ